MTQRIPLAVYVLSANVFLLGTTEFMIVGLLPEIAQDLAVPLPDAGLLISAFALGLAVGTPLLAVVTLRIPRPAMLLGASAIFLLGHLASVLAAGYMALMIARAGTALAAGASWIAAYVLVVRLAPAGLTARALAVMIGGLTLSNIVGVPGGTWLGHEWGWRWTFGALAVLTAVTMVGIALVMPLRHPDDESPPDVRSELRVFRSRGIWLALATTASFQTTMFAALSYLSPMLIEVAGLAADHVPIVLGLFGVGGLIGVTIGGKVADRNLVGNLVVSLIALALTLTFLAVASRSTPVVVMAVVTVAVAGYSVAPALNARVFAAASGVPTLAASANMSAFNTGNVIGPWIGGLVLASGWGLVAPVWLAAGLAVVTLTIVVVAHRLERSSEPAHARETAVTASTVDS